MFNDEHALWRVTTAFALAGGIVADSGGLMDLAVSSLDLALANPSECAAIAVSAVVAAHFLGNG